MISLSKVKQRTKKKNDASFKKLFFFASKFSVYFSWIFINLGLNANQVTGIFFLTGLVACCFFSVFDSMFILVGVVLWRLHIIFDLCDGEVARFNKSFSINGVYWDYMIHAVLFPSCFFAISFALCRNFSNENFLVVGALGAIVLSLVLAVKNNYYRAMLFSGLTLDNNASARKKNDVKYRVRDLILYLTSFDAFILIYLGFSFMDLPESTYFILMLVYILFFSAISGLKFLLFSRDGLYQRRS